MVGSCTVVVDNSLLSFLFLLLRLSEGDIVHDTMDE